MLEEFFVTCERPLMGIKIVNSDVFCAEIEERYINYKDLTYLEVIMEYIEEKKIDIDNVPKLLNKTIKEKMQAECYDYNLLKNKPQKLPLVKDD